MIKMLKLHKKIIIPLCFVLTCSVGFSVVFARHHHKPLHNGDIVFDAKRFHDSVLETAKQALVASQTAKELSIRALNHASVDFSSTVNGAINRYKNKYVGENLNNPDKALDSLLDSPIYHADQYYNPNDFEMAVDSYLTKVHADTAMVEKSVVNQTAQRMKDMDTINRTSTPGQMGEIQKNSSLSVLRGLNTADEARLEGSKMASDIADREAKTSREVYARQLVAQDTIVISDPYNPTEYDKEHRPQIDNFGFLSTQQTE